jgi:hypothetical protein
MLSIETDFTPSHHHLVLWLHCQLFVYCLWAGTRSLETGVTRLAIKVRHRSFIRLHLSSDRGWSLKTDFTPVFKEYHLQEAGNGPIRLWKRDLSNKRYLGRAGCNHDSEMRETWRTD